MSVLVCRVGAQSQDSINPEFNASSTDEEYYLLNYDCTNLPWPEGVTGVYRKFDKENATVNQYYIYEGETIVELENSSSTKLTITPGTNLDADGNIRLVPTPTLAPLATGSDNETIVCIQEDGSAIAANLVPPTLQQIENYFLDIIYIFWAFIGVYAVIQIVWIGIQFMTNATSPERMGNVVSKAMWWLIGLILAFIAIPALHFFFDVLNIQTTKCYCLKDNATGDCEESGDIVYDLTVPGFTFFFKDACTDGDELN